MSLIDIIVLLALITVFAIAVYRWLKNRRLRKENPGCASGCSGCTRCPSGKR